MSSTNLSHHSSYLCIYMYLCMFLSYKLLLSVGKTACVYNFLKIDSLMNIYFSIPIAELGNVGLSPSGALRYLNNLVLNSRLTL